VIVRWKFMSLAMPELETLSRREQLRASLTGWMPWVGKGSLAILDQGLFAGSNFLLNVLLARWLTPSEYGAFAIAFSVFLLLGIFHGAILTEPMMVFGPGKYRERFPEYLGILLRGHFALMLACAALLAATVFLLGWLYSPAVGRAFLALAIAAPFILLLSLLRRAFYVRLNPGGAAAGGAVYLLVLLGSTLTLRTAGRLTPATGFLAMAAASLITCLVLLVALRPRLATESSTIRAIAADHWRYGRWSVASAGISWFPGNIYYVLLPAWWGLEGVGALKALMNLAMPAAQSINALSGLLLPLLVVHRKERGSLGMAKTMRSFLALFLLGAALYLAVLWGLRSELFRLLYAGKYTEYASWPLLLTGVLPLAACVTAVLGSALCALERPDWVFWCYLASSIVALLVGILLIVKMGVTGALLGMLFSCLTAGALMLWFYLRSDAKSLSLERDDSSHEIGV
jgi:O-antigen/teichoic acid export membrane protein